ncbi:MAG: hypothetical protein AB7J28_11545 [Hyphomonadaceae bacterium]
MLEALIVLILQAVAGEPSAPPPQQHPQQQSAESAERQQSVENGENDDVVVCRDYPRIGSRIPRRLCMTERERREVRERQQEALRQFTRPGDICYHC